jgi:predicted ATPase/DNA-binding CsgD family transcriptional regulator
MHPDDRAVSMAGSHGLRTQQDVFAQLGKLVPLPEPVSRFVGRQSEARELRSRLAQTRLLTLTGPGGCGKTRLAIELARQAAEDFPDGVAFVDLAPIASARLVVDAVSAALGLRPRQSNELAEAIGGAQLLLLIDNVEHVVDAVGCTAYDLLVRCPRLQFLLTSRRQLGIDGEVSWRVSPLALPAHSEYRGKPACTSMAEYDAIKLFCLRAGEQDSAFRLCPDNVRLVLEICRRLDGIPLALELAAAWTGRIALAEVAARLEGGFSFLGHRAGTASSRHATLEASMDWSYGLLDNSAQQMLARLSVFAGTFDLQAIRSVCTDGDLGGELVLHIVKQLVDLSLLQSQPDRADDLRYRLLEVVRQHALSRIGDEDRAQVSARHAAYYAGLVKREADEPDVKGAASRIAGEYSNIRVALDWAADNDPAMESSMVLALLAFWKLSGLVCEARTRIEATLARGAASIPTRVRLHVEGAAWARQAGDMREALEHIECASRLRPHIEDPIVSGWIVGQRAVLLAVSGQVELAERGFEEAIAILDRNPPSGELVATINNLAMMRLLTDRPLDALQAIERAVNTQTGLPAGSQTAKLLHTHGEVLLALGRGEEACNRFLDAFQYAAEYDNLESAIPLLQGLARAFNAGNRPSLCLEFLAASQACARAAGVHTHFADAARIEHRSRLALGPTAAEAAWTRGAELDLRGALDRAREACGTPEAPVLSPRKSEIVKLVAAGLSNKEIAVRMGISPRTAEKHLDQLREQMGFHNRQQLALWAIRLGLARLPQEPRDDGDGSATDLRRSPDRQRGRGPGLTRH